MFSFSVLVDKASDCSNQQKLLFGLRYVNKFNEMRKHFFFFFFLHCELSFSGKA